MLLAHGSRDDRWRAPIEAVARRVGERAPGVPVRCAYLELCAPDLPSAADELVGAGAQSIRVVPLFLGMGKHAREDLPRLVEALRQRHAAVSFTLAEAVGEDPELTDLLARIALKT